MGKQLYMYQEYNDYSLGDIITKVFYNRDELMNYLKKRVEKFFNCSWDKIKENYHVPDDDLTMEDGFVRYYDQDADYYWEVTKTEFFNNEEV